MIKYVLLVFLIFFLLLYAKIKICIIYETELTLTLRYLFFKIDLLKLQNLKNPFAKKEKAEDEEKEKEKKIKKKKEIKEILDEIKGIIKTIKVTLKSFAKGIIVEKIYLDFLYGTGDNMTTGISYGGVMFAAGGIYDMLNSTFKVKKAHINITPVFNQEIIKGKCDIVIYTRATSIIWSGILGGITFLFEKQKLKNKA